MSITMCVGLVMLIMLFIGGMKPKWFVFLLVAAAVAVPVMILVEPYRLKKDFLLLSTHGLRPRTKGYQLIQSLYALGGAAGGLESDCSTAVRNTRFCRLRKAISCFPS